MKLIVTKFYTRSLLAVIPLALVFAATTTQAKPAKPAKKLRVAVLEFENSSSDAGLEALGKGLQSMVTTDLSKVSSLTLVERARLQEIVKEQKLGRSGAVDKKTAAKIGKLSGASHLLTGTYTVHGASMRLDARLFATKSGKVLLAEEMTGDKDAFFELEKSLVKKLIKGLGIDLAPKERAGIAKIHTADFKAFASYSVGMQQFDEQKYDAAMKSLREASAIDEDFDLARLTLDQYEEVVAQLRARADSMEVTKKELEKLKMDETARDDAEVIEALLKVIDTKNTRPALRYSALVHLAGMYNPKGRNHGRVSRFQDRQDQFVARRTAAAVARQMLTISLKSFPSIPLIPTATQPPKTAADLPKRLEGMAGVFEGKHRREDSWQRDLAKNLTHADSFAEIALMTPREAASLLQKALKATKQASAADEQVKAKILEALADRYLAMGDLGAAGSAMSQWAKIETYAPRVKRIAEEVENLGAVTKRLRSVKHKALAAEYVADRGKSVKPKDLDQFDAALDRNVLRRIMNIRELKTWSIYHSNHFFFAGTPAFVILGDDNVVTGPRTDGMHSDSLRYYRNPDDDRKRPYDSLVVLGESGFTALKAKFQLNFKAADDFWPKRAGKATTPAELDLGDDRPDIAFAFGIHDISRDDFRDEETNKNMYPGPRALALQITADAVRLVELGQAAAYPDRARALPVKVLGKKSRTRGKANVSVTVEVDKRSVRAKVGGDSFRFDLPSGAQVTGYAGFHATGVGYVEVTKPSIQER